MAATRLSDSQKQELVARFCAGASLQQLAALFGCSPTTVSRAAKAAIDLADYELLLKQQKAQRGGTPPGDRAPLGELPPERGAGPGDALAAVTLTLAEPAERPAVASTVGSYDLEEPSEQSSQGPSLEAAGDSVQVPVQELPGAQQGALDFPGDQQLAMASPALPSPLADALDEPPAVTAVPPPILGRRRRSGAATPIPPPTPAGSGTDLNPVDSLGDSDLVPDLDGEQPVLRVLPDRTMSRAPAGLESAPAPAANSPAPVAIAPLAGPGELAINDADDFGADDAEDDPNDDDLSDDSGEELFFAQGETFVAIPLGPIIDDLAIHGAVPFNVAALPTSAFLLVDKTVELQARRLRELPELGRLAEDELDRQALVVFVNPRQAKRQCGRTQRVIPLPDPSLLERTAPYLVAQGITRLVIEGALYALPGG